MKKALTGLFASSIACGILLAPAQAGTLTCEMGSEAVCDAFCSKVGGGMQSNPDGSTTCNFAMLSENPKVDVDKANAADWLLINFPDKHKK